jgi:hypothetical protein
MDVRAVLSRLNAPTLLDTIMTGAAEEFVARFSRLEEAVIDTLGDEEGRMWWPRTRGEVMVLLS